MRNNFVDNISAINTSDKIGCIEEDCLIGYRLSLLSGLRKEEVTDLKWSDIYHSGDVTFFMIKNKKVERNHNIKGYFYKYILM